MADYYTEEIQKRLDSLPADIKALVYSADMSAIMQTIGQKYKLHVDQISSLESEAVAVMIGITKPEEFTQELTDALSVPKEIADGIASDVNSQLFLKIRESMKGVGRGGDQPPQKQSLPTRAASMSPQVPRATEQNFATISQNQSENSAQTPSNQELSAKAPAPMPVPIVTAKPTVPPPMPEVDAMLSQKTVAKPIYKTDPYREPPE